MVHLPETTHGIITACVILASAAWAIDSIYNMVCQYRLDTERALRQKDLRIAQNIEMDRQKREAAALTSYTARFNKVFSDYAEAMDTALLLPLEDQMAVIDLARVHFNEELATLQQERAK